MKKESLWNATVILILASLVAITLTPLALMFRTSLKPAGTLTRNFGELKLTAETGTGSVVRLRLGQDLRKFSTLSFLIRGTLYRGTFEVIFYDMQGNWCAADSSPYLKGGIGNQWRRFTLPLQNLPIASINPGFPEKIAEVLIVRAQDPENPITLKEIKLTAKKFSLANYADVLISASFGRYLFNSALIAIIITLGNLVFCTLAGYAFARKDFPFKNLLFMLILASVIIPAQVLIIPIFLVMENIGWLNSYLALIIPSLVQPFGIFLMKQYISSLPTSYEDQARVDGATERQILFKIIFPLSRPALAIV
ncbi:MAG: carbohydrate ABC transporter permease, partial [Candidatus Omnitrophota bacterium]